MRDPFLNRLLLTAFLCCGTVIASAQTTDRDVGVTAFEAGDYSRAITFLKRATKSNASDAQAWATLGSAYLKEGLTNDATKSFERAVKLEPKNDVYLSGLAGAYVAAQSDKASKTAHVALALNPGNAYAHFVLGSVALNDGAFLTAYQRAKRAIELDQKLAAAHRLKSRALVGSYIAQTEPVIKPSEKRYELLSEAAVDLKRFLDLTNDTEVREYYLGQIDGLEFFAEWFSNPENPPWPSIRTPSVNDPSKTPLKILTKRPPNYTEYARQNGIGGQVVLMVAFQADGKIGPIMILKSLEPGLDIQAVKAARAITFTPETNVGVPITVVKTLEYTFAVL